MNFGIINVLGLILFLIGLTIRLIGKRTLVKYYSLGLRTLAGHELIKKGFYRYISIQFILLPLYMVLGFHYFFQVYMVLL